MLFSNRMEAGRKLGLKLRAAGYVNGVVLGLPRGGVVVAAVVASVLQSPLDVLVVRKLGSPYNHEFALGALGEGGVVVWNQTARAEEEIGDRARTAVVERELVELERRIELFRAGRKPLAIVGRTVTIVDDGLATGATARAACLVARAKGASRVILAVPVAPMELTKAFVGDADDLVCLESPWAFAAVGQWYSDFTQTTDEEVVALLQKSADGIALDAID